LGSALDEGQPADYCATAVSRLQNAGAINLGFLNMAEFAIGPTGHNETFGDCRNPWDPTRITGGSSSGAAAAVAGGMVTAAIGSDTGGSIRIPAACCGVVGLKPTPGRVSCYGAMPLAPSLDSIGPLARTAYDCDLIFGNLVGSDPNDQRSIHAPSWSPRTPRSFDPRAVPLFYPRAAIVAGASEQICAALDSAITRFASFSFSVETDVALPSLTELHTLGDIVLTTEAAATQAEGMARAKWRYPTHVRQRIMRGFEILAPTYFTALENRSHRLNNFLMKTIRDNGILVLPTLGCEVPTIAETNPTRLGFMPELVTKLTWWTRWLNYLGVPALSVPCGKDRNGMPIGMQLVTSPFGERRLLDTAIFYESHVDWRK